MKSLLVSTMISLLDSMLLRSKLRKGNVYACGENCGHNLPTQHKVSHRLLEESSNLLAAPAPQEEPESSTGNGPAVLRSGAFPAAKDHIAPQLNQSTPTQQQSQYGDYIIALIVYLALLVLLTLFLIYLRRGNKPVHPRDASLLHRLSKAFVTGVPKLNSSELQTACEDFSNIIDTSHGHLMYKGILSSGVEIAVISTTVRSSQQWPAHAEREFKRKLDLLSRINHKNFVNLIGYCEDEDPFVRMMVFEYAPNGTLYEHLHVKDAEHLDWHLRMRAIMGTSYCLEYMHHELDPPVTFPIQSDTILLTDDYAAKVINNTVWADIASKADISDEVESEHVVSDPAPGMKDNVYSFGVLLLEIISAKSSGMKEQCPIQWSSRYLKDKQNLESLLDPTLKSFKNDQLEIICEVIKECTNEDPEQRPSMKEVTCKLRQVINISPEAATERISPLWWAELELLAEDTD